MKKLFIVTGNKSKLLEFRAILEPLGFTVENRKFELVEPKTFDQREVAIATAKQAFTLLKKPVITDDTGIFFENYNNFPGTYTKFLFPAIGIDGIRRLMRINNKKAYFQTTLCFYDGKTIETFQGQLKGRITLDASGKFNPDWSYDTMFIPNDAKKHFSEFTLEERKQISHRSKAINKLLKFLKEYYEQ